MLAVAGYFAYSAFQHVTPFLTPAGCQAGSGTSAVALDPQQASIAATIAGVAARDRLPARAVTIAYATAMQESHMHNLDYGDLDSVGVFQQRPSEGWGTASQLEDPVYATTKFFGALTQVPGYLQMPVDEAAQAVQHSADGSAYAQYDLMATLDDQRVHRSMAARGLVLAWPRAVAAAAEPGRLRPGAGRGLRARRGRTADYRDHLGPLGQIRERGRAGAAGGRLDGGVVAGDARAAVRHQRRAVRRLPVDGVGRQPGMAAGQRDGQPGRRNERDQRKYPAALRHTMLGTGILIANGNQLTGDPRPLVARRTGLWPE